MAERESYGEERRRTITPRLAMFETFKRFGGLSYKRVARLLLSDRPQGEESSPIARADTSRTWVSREVVHGVDRLNRSGLFASCDESSLRVLARLKSARGRDASSILAELTSGRASRLMLDALESAGAGATIYGNMLVRLMDNRSLTEDERVEVAMVLFVTAGCMQDGREAVRTALGFTYLTHGSRWDADAGVQHSHACRRAGAALEGGSTLGLVRMEGDVMVGNLRRVPFDCAGVTVGMLALGENDVVDVESDVSDRHARIWCDEEGVWRVEDLGSFAGTCLVRTNGEEGVRLAPWTPTSIVPGDTLRFGSSTTYATVKVDRAVC